MAVVQFKNFKAYYKLKGDRYAVALDNLNFSVNKGEFWAVIGKSGCGKTTLLKSIMGFQKLTEGDIYLNDRNLDDIDIRKENISYVAQDYNLYPSMTVYENIAYPLKLMHTDMDELDKRVKDIAAKLELTYLLTRKPKQLSGGQHQKVSIARALIKNPRLILFDEPFANIDPEMRIRLLELVKKIHTEYKTTIIFVTHNLQEALFLADKILVLDKGTVQRIGTKEEIEALMLS